MTRDDIAEVIRKIPALNAHGVGIFEGGRGLSATQREELLERETRELLGSEDACTRICEWLKDITPIKTVEQSSYSLKHVAEPEIGYVTNGSFIAAAVHSGFPFRVNPGSPNVSFGMSEKSIKAKRRQNKGPTAPTNTPEA